MTLQDWKQRNEKSKKYAHFDKRINLSNVWNYINNPKKVAQHGFYPFVHYTQRFNKFSKGEIKPKERELCYSAHIDRYIYSYYGYKLNQKYDKRAVDDGINDVALAYRDNLGLNNIHFSKIAIDFIRSQKECWVMVGDFTHFFDNLDHKYLKDQICELLKVNILPKDFYAVYKNITQYTTWELSEILAYHNLTDCKDDINKLNSMERLLSVNEFRYLKHHLDIKENKNNKGYGIPQGSAISAVLSNIYMLTTDKIMNDYIIQLGGLYMRYSDDFIIIIPKSNIKFEDVFIKINQIIHNTPRLVLQEEKTQLYHYANLELTNVNSKFMSNIPNGANRINYLGFTFDGKEVTIRDKTITKYYYRLYRKLKTIVRNEGITKYGHRISTENLYDRYSIKGAKKKRGNFITYVNRAEKIWGENEPINRSTKRHMVKIRRRLDEIYRNANN